MTGGELFVECLKAQGVKDIFGIPGGHLDPVYESLYKNRDTIHHYVGRHEGGCAFMADGYARTTGEVGVCMTVPGPGAAQRCHRNWRSIHSLLAGAAGYRTESLPSCQKRSGEDVPRLRSEGCVCNNDEAHRTCSSG